MNEHEPQGIAAEMLVEAAAEGVTVADAYEITTVIPYATKEPEVKHYTLPPQDMDEFFHDYSQTSEVVVDIRPVET